MQSTVKKYILNKYSNIDLFKLSKKYRIELFEKFLQIKQGHPGSVFSIIDLLTFLFYSNFIRLNEYKKEILDLLVISKGHATVACYPILRDFGIIPEKDWKNWIPNNKQTSLRVFGNKSIPGIQIATGSLGHGVGIGVGRAISAKNNNDENFTAWIVISEGELYEGSTWEAMLLAHHHNLDNLVVFVDVNNLIILGKTEECNALININEKFRAFGFDVSEANGHDFRSIENAMHIVKRKNNKPKVIILNTIKGKGISQWENKANWHYWNDMSENEIKKARLELNGSS